MAAIVKVIEFYGLPGCGKTTLRSNLLFSHSKQVGSIEDVMILYNNEPFFYRLFHLPIKQWFLLSIFLMTMPHKRKNSKSFYVALYYKVLAYTYCATKSPLDFVVVDHGIVQQLGSILHNMDYRLSDKSMKRFIMFLNSIEKTIFTYCQISSELSLNRIRFRKRDGGRVDAVMNDTNQAMFYLEKERLLFDRISDALDNNIFIIDMSKTPEELTTEVVRIMGV